MLSTDNEVNEMGRQID